MQMPLKTMQMPLKNKIKMNIYLSSYLSRIRERAPGQRPRGALERPCIGALGPEGLGPLGTWALGRTRARSRSPHNHARLTKTGAAADNGSLHADPAAHTTMLG
jgi:hypothetical protein